MHGLRHYMASALLAGLSGADLPAPETAVFSTSTAIVRPGFYRVGGRPRCSAVFGPTVFLPQRSGTLIMAGGTSRPALLGRETDSSYAIVGSGCILAFANNDLRTLGICTRVLSHRGDSRTFPANTLPAFQDAMVQGFAGFELDVRFSGDGVAIVSHDDNLAVGTDCRGRISQRDARAVTRCRALRTPLLPESRLLARRAQLAAPVPTLREALARFLPDPRTRRIVIDIKVFRGGPEMVEALAAAVPGCPGPDCRSNQRRLTFISQDSRDAALLNAAFPDSQIALESNDTVSGLIDEPEGDHWHNPHIDTYSLSFNSLFDIKLKLVKLVRGENLTPVQRFRHFYETNLGLPRPRRLLGWTINNRSGVRGLRDYAFADVLTDMRYAEFVRQLMGVVPVTEMEANLDRIGRGQGIGCEG